MRSAMIQSALLSLISWSVPLIGRVLTERRRLLASRPVA
jgi:hypothetical protein